MTIYNDTNLSIEIQIVRMKVQRKGRDGAVVTLDLSDGSSHTLHEDVVVRHALYAGKAVSQKQINQWEETTIERNVELRALRYLTRRAHATSELKQKLINTGEQEQVVEIVIKRIQAQGYLDDKTFAKQWVEFRVLQQRKGRGWVKQELKQKGVEDQLIQIALEALDEDAEEQEMYNVGRKHWLKLLRQQNTDSQKQKQKWFSFMERRGIAMGLIYHLWKRIQNGKDDI